MCSRAAQSGSIKIAPCYLTASSPDLVCPIECKCPIGRSSIQYHYKKFPMWKDMFSFRLSMACGRRLLILTFSSYKLVDGWEERNMAHYLPTCWVTERNIEKNVRMFRKCKQSTIIFFVLVLWGYLNFSKSLEIYNNKDLNLCLELDGSNGLQKLKYSVPVQISHQYHV